MTLSLDQALAAIPDSLRRPLLDLYDDALAEYRAGRWESVGTKAGKFCEVVYSIIHGRVSGKFPVRPSKPKNMVDDCRKLEPHWKTYGRALCIQVPRLLPAVYEMRNNRDIGHVGGEVDSNHMDAEFMIRSVKWLMAEMVRNFGNLDTDAARELIESVTERSFHVVWSEGDTKRVLNTALNMKQKTLVLLYASGGKVTLDQLFAWTEHSNKSVFRKKVVMPLHKDAYVHFDQSSKMVTLLPPGMRHVEDNGILEF